jgi:hypothetical protein
VPQLVEAAYSSQSEDNTIVWTEIDRVDDEVLGEELVSEGSLTVTPVDGAIYKQVLTDETVSYFIGDNAATENLQSVKKVTSGTIIGTARVPSLHDLTGRGKHLAQATETAQIQLDSETGVLSTDGTDEYAEVELDRYTPWIYPSDNVGVVHDITSVEDEVLGDELANFPAVIGDGVNYYIESDGQNITIVSDGTDISTSISGFPSKLLRIQIYNRTGDAHIKLINSSFEGQLEKYLYGEVCLYGFSGESIGIKRGSAGTCSFTISVKEVLSGTITGKTTLRIGKSAANAYTPHTLKGLITCRRTPTALEQAEILNWYNSVIDPVQQLVNHVSQSKDNALAYLQSKDPVALWVPGMQEDGKRVDGDTIYLTQLTDLSGNGNHAVQATDTAQAYLDGSDAVFSGGQWYDAMGNFADKPYTICTGIKPNLVQDHMGIWSLSSNNTNDYYEAHITNSVTGSSYLMTRINDRTNHIDSNNADFIDGQLHATIVNFGSTGRFFMVNGITILEDSFTGSPVGDLVRMSCGSLTRYEARTDYLNGGISSQAIYNKALTTSEQTIVNQCLTTLGA